MEIQIGDSADRVCRGLTGLLLCYLGIILLVAVLAFSALGVLLNALDLTRGTRFTNDPQLGLVLSILLVPFYIGFYLFVQKRGSRSDDRLLAFIETTLAARLTG
jgi:hypothetical protein